MDPAPTRNPWLNSLFLDHAFLRIPWRNWGVVESGRLYRSNHPTPWQVRQAVRRHGIRTVINLRGNRPECGSDVLGRTEALRLGVTYVDVALESRGAPSWERIENLVEVYRRMEEPALIHCKSGADRTGLGAGIWMLMQGRSVDEALAQLTLRHGHIAAAKTGILDAFFLSYRAFIQQHGPKPFLDWVRDDYDPEALRAAFRSKPWADRIVDGVLRRE